MYRVTASNLSIVCQSQESVLAWIDFLLDQGHVPEIKYTKTE